MIFSCSAAMFIGSTWKGSCPVNMAYRFIPLKVHLLASDLMIVVASLIHDTCFNVPNEMNAYDLMTTYFSVTWMNYRSAVTLV